MVRMEQLHNLLAEMVNRIQRYKFQDHIMDITVSSNIFMTRQKYVIIDILKYNERNKR